MKIRDGFVSNSSSSSFLIFGAWVDKSAVERFLSEEQLEQVESDGLEEVMYDTSIDMFYHFDHYGDRCAFGRCWSGVRNDETGKQFKESVKKSLKETFGKTIKCSTIEHTYMC